MRLSPSAGRALGDGHTEREEGMAPVSRTITRGGRRDPVTLRVVRHAEFHGSELSSAELSCRDFQFRFPPDPMGGGPGQGMEEAGSSTQPGSAGTPLL
ncbi:hypothetical protein chiPu_0029237 [Chiloscyllium punctatum]|uniref:Uncharacterized protein n=1 Tax=Chiloscyllium punctatum TaxID=137246 RepID=A0A401TRR0_CHIPU|nr:hypothetical protein [Chiloscyllium punctatum]